MTSPPSARRQDQFGDALADSRIVAIRGIDATAVELGLVFRVADVGKRLAAKNEIYDLVYRHA